MFHKKLKKYMVNNNNKLQEIIYNMRDYIFTFYNSHKSTLQFIQDYPNTLYELILNHPNIFSDVILGVLSNHKFDVNVLLKIHETYDIDMTLKYIRMCQNITVDMYLLNILLDNDIIKSANDPNLHNLLTPLTKIEPECAYWLIMNGFKLRETDVHILKELTNDLGIDLVCKYGCTNDLCMLLNLLLCEPINVNKVQMLLNLINMEDYHKYCCERDYGDEYLQIYKIINKYDIDTYIDIQTDNIDSGIITNQYVDRACKHIKTLIPHVGHEHIKYVAAELLAYATYY
jgi:hypothetical protein